MAEFAVVVLHRVDDGLGCSSGFKESQELGLSGMSEVPVQSGYQALAFDRVVVSDLLKDAGRVEALIVTMSFVRIMARFRRRLVVLVLDIGVFLALFSAGADGVADR